MIHLTGLDLKVDQQSPYGLAFTLREDAQIFEAPILNKEGRFNSADVDEQTGLPRKVGIEGDRHLWTRDDDLSRLFLDWDLGLGSADDGLADSGSGGLVVVVRGEAAQKIRAPTLEETVQLLRPGVRESERPEFNAKLRRLYEQYIEEKI